MSKTLDDFRSRFAPKFPELKNLRLLLDLRLISKNSDASTASLAWNHLCTDAVIYARLLADPDRGEDKDITHCGHPKHFRLNEACLHKIVRQMTDEERAELRARLLARRVTKLQTPLPTSAAEVLKI
jgi:hypothetical protein